MSDSLLTTNCWILGHDYHKVFQVEISRDKDVADLKEAIKTKKQNTLKDIDAYALIIYKASIPYSPQLAEHAAALGLNELKLQPLDKLSGFFANGLLDMHVHMVVEVPSGAWVYMYVVFVIIALTCFAVPQTPPREFLVFEYSRNL